MVGTPHLVKTLLNGGGGLSGAHRGGNAGSQTRGRHREALGEHEKREWQQYGTLGEAVTRVRERVAAVEALVGGKA
jgi:hypothetical protein